MELAGVHGENQGKRKRNGQGGVWSREEQNSERYAEAFW